MDSLSFEIVLNYGMETLTIKPPNSYISLLEIAKEKYDLTIVNRLVYYDEGGEEVKISNDTDYLNFFDYASLNELKEIDIIIKSDESKSKRKKSTQLRKRSSVLKPPSGGVITNDDCVNGKQKFYLVKFNL